MPKRKLSEVIAAITHVPAVTKPAFTQEGFLDDFPFSTNPDGVAAIIKDGKMRKLTREELVELIEKATIGGV
jgi:hypothetical protein